MAARKGLRSVILGVVLAVAMVGPVGGSTPSPYLTFLEHIGTSTAGIPSLSEWSAEDMQEWARGEVAWLLENPPQECYAVEWGSWMRVVSTIEGWGFMREALVPDRVLGTYMDDVVLPSMEAHSGFQEAALASIGSCW